MAVQPQRNIFRPSGEKELNELLQQNHISFLKFYVENCSNCEKIAPVFQDLAEKYHDYAAFIMIEVSKFKNLVTQYKVKLEPMEPTIIALVDGKEERRYGGTDTQQWITLVESLVGSRRSSQQQQSGLQSGQQQQTGLKTQQQQQSGVQSAKQSGMQSGMQPGMQSSGGSGMQSGQKMQQ